MKFIGVFLLLWAGATAWILMDEVSLGEGLAESLSTVQWHVVMSQSFYYAAILFAIYHLVTKRKRLAEAAGAADKT